MPKIGITHKGQVQTRNSYTKIDSEIAFVVDGRELPSMAVLGDAMEAAIKVFELKIKKSYEEVPPRIDTPMAEPYAGKPVS